MKSLFKNALRKSKLSLLSIALILFLSLLFSLLLRYCHDCETLPQCLPSSSQHQVPLGWQEASKPGAPGGARQCPATSPSCCSTAQQGAGGRAWKITHQLCLLQPPQQRAAVPGACLQVPVGLVCLHSTTCLGWPRVSPHQIYGFCSGFWYAISKTVV